MNEHIKFCLEWQRRWNEAEGGRVDVAELCRVFGVSRQRGYVWLWRYREAAPSRCRPWSCGRASATRGGTAEASSVAGAAVPSARVPGASAMASIPKRHGLTSTYRQQRGGRPGGGRADRSCDDTEIGLVHPRQQYQLDVIANAVAAIALAGKRPSVRRCLPAQGLPPGDKAPPQATAVPAALEALATARVRVESRSSTA